MARYSKEEVEHAQVMLGRYVKPGAIVWTSLRHVSRSNMRREIAVLVVHKGEIINISWSVCRVLGMTMSKRDACVIDGAGEDKGFVIVYNLGRKLFTPEADPSKSNRRDAGYALNHRWV